MEQDCNQQACAIDCEVGAWSGWSTWTTSCGTGSQTRSRTTISPVHGGKACPVSFQRQRCNTQACAIDCSVGCVVSAWSKYNTCSHSCSDEFGIGTQMRTRKVVTKPAFGGKACLHQKENRVCNDHIKCPVDCVGAWQAWEPCSASC